MVLRTLGAKPRRLVGSKRPRAVDGAAEPEPIPTARATLVHADALGSEDEARGWLEGLRRDRDALDAEVERAARELNAVLRAHRAASGDPYAIQVARPLANVVRVGWGNGDQVAEGRWGAAYVLPEPRERRRRGEVLAPQERMAALLGGAERLLVGEELLLRARLDLDAGRTREAALQARIALEALLAELRGSRGAEDLAAHRGAVGEAANAALQGEPPPELAAAVADAVAEMQRALRRSRATPS